MDPSESEENGMEVDPFAEEMPLPDELLFDSQVTVYPVSPDMFEGLDEEGATKSKDLFENKSESDNMSNPVYQSSPDIFGPDWGNANEDATHSQNVDPKSECDGDNITGSKVENYQSSPLMFEDYSEDDETQFQNLCGEENPDSKNSVEFFAIKESRTLPDIFGDDCDNVHDDTQSQNLFAHEEPESENSVEFLGYGDTTYHSPGDMFEGYPDDDNNSQKAKTNPPSSATSSQKPSDDYPIHLISALKGQGVSENNVTTLCKNGFDTVESYILASTNNRYAVPCLDEATRIEIEAAARAIVPDFGFTQATQIHRDVESPDIFTVDDALPSTSGTTLPARRIHLISEIELPSPEIQQILVSKGYVSAESLLTATIPEVVRLTKLSKEVVVIIQNAAREAVPDFGFTQTMQLYQRKSDTVPITTGSSGIDKLLGGGVAPGVLTQIFGESGSGKTQICHSLAVHCQIPRTKGGAEGKCIYLDTRKSFRTERLVAIAISLNMDANTVLDNIAYAHIRTTGQQAVLLHQAPSLLCSGSYSLLILDDLMTIYREEYSNASEIAARQIQLTKFLKSLLNLANQYHIAVVFVNQVVRQLDATKPLFGQNIPAGGQIVALFSETRLCLTKGNGGFRLANLYDQEDQKEEKAAFYITGSGIADHKEMN